MSGVSHGQAQARRRMSCGTHKVLVKVEAHAAVVAAVKAKVDLANRPHLVNDNTETAHLHRLRILSHEAKQHSVGRHVTNTRRRQRPMQRHLETVDMLVHPLGQRVGEDLCGTGRQSQIRHEPKGRGCVKCA